MKEAEYNSLRAELIGEQSNQVNILIAMYTIFIAIMTYAVDKNIVYLFLLVIVVNLLFKLQLLWKQAGILRISAYISTKFEDKETGLSWESDIEKCKDYREKELKRWFKIIGFSSAKMSSFLSIIAYFTNIILLQDSGKPLFAIVIELVLGGTIIAASLYIDRLQSPEKLRKLFEKEFTDFFKLSSDSEDD